MERGGEELKKVREGGSGGGREAWQEREAVREEGEGREWRGAGG